MAIDATNNSRADSVLEPPARNIFRFCISVWENYWIEPAKLVWLS